MPIITQARALIASLIVLALAAGGGYAWWTRKALKEANARVATAEQQTEVAEATTQIVERVVRSEVTIRTQAERSADAVQSATGADAPLDPDLRARICAGVAGLRDGAQACDDHRPSSSP